MDENIEVREYVDDNGCCVWWIVKIIMMIWISLKNGFSNVIIEIKEIKSGGYDLDKIVINFGGGVLCFVEEYIKF